MKYYINEHDAENLPLWVEAESYEEARNKLNDLIGIISEEDLKEVQEYQLKDKGR